MVQAERQLDAGSTIGGERHGTSDAHLGLRHRLEERHGGGWWAEAQLVEAGRHLWDLAEAKIETNSRVRSVRQQILCQKNWRKIHQLPTSGCTTFAGHLQWDYGMVHLYAFRMVYLGIFKIQMKYEYVRITSTVCLPIPDATESSVLS